MTKKRPGFRVKGPASGKLGRSQLATSLSRAFARQNVLSSRYIFSWRPVVRKAG